MIIVDFKIRLLCYTLQKQARFHQTQSLYYIYIYIDLYIILTVSRNEKVHNYLHCPLFRHLPDSEQILRCKLGASENNHGLVSAVSFNSDATRIIVGHSKGHVSSNSCFIFKVAFLSL